MSRSGEATAEVSASISQKRGAILANVYASSEVFIPIKQDKFLLSDARILINSTQILIKLRDENLGGGKLALLKDLINANFP
ncbi:MAG: hypothetical protein V1649_04790 [Patescibacteria group bacterium]